MGDNPSNLPSTTPATAPAAAATTPAASEAAAPIRAEMIDTAVRFLKNPKVMGAPISRKVAFLESKGLTSAEVAAALAQTEGGASTAATQPALPSPALAPAPTLPPPAPPRTFREILATGTLLAGGGFLLYSLFTKYVLPRIEWPTSTQTDARLQALAESVGRLEAAQRDHAAQQRTLTDGVQARLARVETDSAVGEIRAELATLRTMLLGRGQFPSAPTATWAPAASSAIPKWQLARKGDEAAPEASSSSTALPAAAAAGGASSAPGSLTMNAVAAAAAAATNTQDVEERLSSDSEETGTVSANGAEGLAGAGAGVSADKEQEVA